MQKTTTAELAKDGWSVGRRNVATLRRRASLTSSTTATPTSSTRFCRSGSLSLVCLMQDWRWCERSTAARWAFCRCPPTGSWSSLARARPWQSRRSSPPPVIWSSPFRLGCQASARGWSSPASDRACNTRAHRSWLRTATGRPREGRLAFTTSRAIWEKPPFRRWLLWLCPSWLGDRSSD
jgi:hypothetical protein